MATENVKIQLAISVVPAKKDFSINWMNQVFHVVRYNETKLNYLLILFFYKSTTAVYLQNVEPDVQPEMINRNVLVQREFEAHFTIISLKLK